METTTEKTVVVNDGQTKVVIRGRWASMDPELIEQEFTEGILNKDFMCLSIRSAICEAAEQIPRSL